MSESAPSPAPAGRPRHRFPAWSDGELAPPTRLYLVRHGQTPATVARQFSGGGVDGPGLTEDGHDEARRAGAFIAAQEEQVEAVVASPMTRTRETAAAIIEALSGVGVVTDDGWREVDFGGWEGLTLAEVSERFPDEVAAWWESTAVAPTGGESFDALGTRVSAARDGIVARHPGRNVVVVTHSMPIRALVRAALDAGPSAIYRVQPAPGSVTTLDVHADGIQVVTSLNVRP